MNQKIKKVDDYTPGFTSTRWQTESVCEMNEEEKSLETIKGHEV